MKKQGRGFIWTNEQLDLLKNNYSSDKKEFLETALNKTWNSITTKARKLGLKIDSSNRKYHRCWTKEEEQYLIDNYEFGDLDSIAEKLNRTRKAITERAKLLKITRDPETIRKQSQKYEVNEDFFKIWSGDMAYILGLICSDGHISQPHDGNKVSITLHKNDSYLIGDIYKSINSTHKILYSKNVSIFCIENKHLYDDLVNLGITPAKSKTIGNIDVPKKYIPDFIRGVLDGDGSVYEKTKRAKLVTASEDFANCLSKMLDDINVEHKLYNEGYMYNGKRSDFYVLRILKREAVKSLYNLMYKDTNLYLKRKKQSFERIGVLKEDFDKLYSCNKKAVIAKHIKSGKTIMFDSVKDAIELGFCNKRVYKSLKNKTAHKNYYWKYAMGATNVKV